MLRPIFAALLLFTATPALAGDWRLVSIDVPGEVMAFVDLDSIRAPSATTRRAWMLNVRREASRSGVGARRFEAIMDCPGRRWRPVRMVTYDMANRRIEEVDREGEWMDMAPGTQGAHLLDYVCSNGASRPDARSMGATPPIDAARQVMVERARP